MRIDATATGVAIWIHVSPRSRVASVGGLHGDALRVAVSAPPVDGKANVACVEALALTLGVRKADIELDKASKGRRKRVELSGTAKDLRMRLVTLSELASPLRLK